MTEQGKVADRTFFSELRRINDEDSRTKDEDRRLECLKLAVQAYASGAGGTPTITNLADDFYRFVTKGFN